MPTILCIDDSPTNRRLVERIVWLRAHLTLLEASTGKEGLELARRQPPDLILLDLKLPDLQGDHVLAALKADPATRPISVVIVTAESERKNFQHLYLLGAFDCLTKPLNVARLLAVLDEVVPA
jgi:CheY-like chemotaxis protein